MKATMKPNMTERIRKQVEARKEKYF